MDSEHAGYGAWLIDLDGILYRSFPVRLATIVEVILAGDLRSAFIVYRFRKEQEKMRDDLATQQGDAYKEQIARTAASCGTDAARVTAVIHKWMFQKPAKWIALFRRRRLIDQVLEFRGAGGKIAIVSDYPARLKLESLGLGAIADAVIASGEDGASHRLKPSPDGYLLAAERLGMSASQCLVIGDRVDADGLAAQKAGMAFMKI